MVQPGQGTRHASHSTTEHYRALLQLATAGANLTSVALLQNELLRALCLRQILCLHQENECGVDCWEFSSTASQIQCMSELLCPVSKAHPLSCLARGFLYLLRWCSR